jgi:hypothetical protein
MTDAGSAGVIGAGVRWGGRAVLPNGDQVVWSVADGRRGRRWREAVSADGTLLRTHLLETDRTGRLTRLEIATAAGLLTLHPDLGETVLHGNVVTPTGVRHLSFDRTTVLVDESPASAAIALLGLAGLLEVEATTHVVGVQVDDRLEPRAAAWAVSRLEPRTWRLVEQHDTDAGGGSGREAGGTVGSDASPGGEGRIVRLDEIGLPVLSGESWALET